MEERSELELVEAARQGEKGAYEEMYRRYYWLVYAQALKMTRCEADAHEVCQDVFFQVYRSIQNLREPVYFKTWLFRITHAKSVELFRKSRVQYFEDKDIVNMCSDVEVREDYNPEKNIHKYSDRMVLGEMLQQLKPKHREVVELMYFQQLSLNEIAQLLDISVNTVKTRVFNARKELKTMIRQYERTQGTTLNFQLQGWGALLSSFSFSSLLQKHSTTMMKFCKIAVSSCAVGGMLYIGVSKVLPDFQKSMNITSHEHQPMRLAENAFMEHFQPVTIQHEMCVSAVQGYQILTTWADHEQIKVKAPEEKNEYAPLVEEMKRHGGTYYEMLRESGWIDAYET